MSETDMAIRDWDREVDEECARLIRTGMSPWVAAAKAADNVEKRRKRAATVGREQR